MHARACVQAENFAETINFLEIWGLTSGIFVGECGAFRGTMLKNGVPNEVRWRRKATLAARNGGRANNVTA